MKFIFISVFFPSLINFSSRFNKVKTCECVRKRRHRARARGGVKVLLKICVARRLKFETRGGSDGGAVVGDGARLEQMRFVFFGSSAVFIVHKNDTECENHA